MTRLSPVNPEQTSGKTRELLDQIKSKLGMVPNIFRTLAHSPAALEAYMNFSGALSGTKISAKLREQIALAVGQQNLCQYCTSAHTLLGQKAGLTTPEIISARKGTATDSKSKAALEFTSRFVKERGKATDDDISELRDCGWGEAEICEILATISLNMFTNYFNHAAGTEVDFPVVDMNLK